MPMPVVTAPECQDRFAFVLLHFEVVDLAKMIDRRPYQAATVLTLSLGQSSRSTVPYVASYIAANGCLTTSPLGVTKRYDPSVQLVKGMSMLSRGTVMFADLNVCVTYRPYAPLL